MHLRCLAGAVIALGFTAELDAQTSVVLPNGFATVEGANNNIYPWGRNATAVRYQGIYDSTHFTAQGVTYPILVRRLRWRANATAASWAGGTYSNVEVSCATSAVDFLAASATFASNRGPDFTQVLNGNVAFLGGTGNGTGVPGPTVVDVTFNAPFLYDPTTGNDFLYEIAFAAGSWTGASTACDAVSTGSLCSRIYNLTDPTQPTGTVGLNYGLVVDVEYLPAAGLFPDFRATPRAGNAPLNVQFTDTSYSSDPNGVQQWAWDLDGDNIADAAVPNPSFTYGVEGFYNVSLTVIDGTHGPRSITKNAFIAVDAVDASFTTTTVGASTVRFNDTSLGNPTSWAWDFQNDGIVDSTAQNPVFAFPAPGSYQVKLDVADAFSTDSTIVNLGVGILPIPGFGSTFSSASATRGFYFQTPVRFSIVNAKVPDETGHGLQNVAIYRLAGPVPAFSATASGGLEFYSVGQPSAAPIPCAVSFEAGEWVGVLGACGDASTMRNSYGTPAGPFVSSIFGSPTTLFRMLTQTNLVTSGGTAPYSSENAAALSRVELGISNSTGLSYGAGTASGSGNAAPTLRTTALPRLGTTAELTVTQQDNAIGILLLALGRGNLPLPFGTLLIDPLSYQLSITLNGGTPMNIGATVQQFPVPNDPVLNGAGPVTFQNVNLVPGSPNELSLSNGQEWFAGY
ncbi:MAG: PKD domain-containing protein [Planctomycetes bacterium]|nr:PKD domain-containing protein [Planctomycetota bacterium]